MAVLKVVAGQVVGQPLMKIASPVVTSCGHPGTAAHNNGGHVSHPLRMCVCVYDVVCVCVCVCVCVAAGGQSC
jgi:hypothetical protein